jgi:3-oxosteroid 1-dehydrogenase
MGRSHVIVLGSGAAALTAAVAAHDSGARVSVFEKHHEIGGTSVWSGGMVWIPNNHFQPEIGVEDSHEIAMTYLMSLSHDMIEPRLAEAYVHAGPVMLRYLEERTPVVFRPVVGFPDYHAEHPGGKPEGGRALDCPPFPFDDLGAWKHRVTMSPYYPDPRIAISDTPLGKARPEPIPQEELDRRAVRDERGSGSALVGRLLRACLDRGIEPQTESRGRELIMGDGRVRGVRIETSEGLFDIEGDAVILATGGFEHNAELKRAFLRGPMTHALSIGTNTGDGLAMAMKVGAMLANMREAWWTPVCEVPTTEIATGAALVAGQRTLPRTIMVNKAGRRFVNEAANYNAFGAAFHELDVTRFEYRNLPCWLIFDQGYVDRYGFGMMGGTPGVAPPGYVARADSLEGLADQLGIDAKALMGSVEHWNAMVAAGCDDEFHRGEAAHDTWWGDPTCKGRPEATLGPLDKAPFFALEVKSGTIGTKGGPRVDPNANVLDVDGNPIPGLYAAGNAMGSAMGMTYGGPGGTLGPAMVFGFLAGRHAAGKPLF